MELTQANDGFLSAWRQRLNALRNIPPALKIVWDAGPQVVTSGIASRVVAALIPLAILAVSRRIIDAIVTVIKSHNPVSHGFWWLVALEFGLALLGTVLARLCDYCDGLLVDRFTRHVSVRVMEHASRLDLSSYEDPEFYNKLERARHQATDRIGMVQAFGQLLQGTITAVTLSVSILAFSPVAAPTPHRRGHPRFPGREPFRVPRLCSEHAAHSHSPAVGLPSRSGSQ